MITNPKVSIILPTFNRSGIIAKAIESVRKQTFRDWELIVMDDGSRDNTGDVIAALAKEDPRILYVRKDNEGLSPTRAKGISHARGEYVCLIDDDDFYLPNKLAVQAAYLDANPEKGLVYSYVDQVTGEGVFVRKLPVKPADSFEELVNECTIQVVSVMVRKSCFDTLGSFRPDMRGIDDYEMWLRISRSYPIGFLPETVGLYVRHQSNMGSNTQLRYDSLMDLYRVLLGWDLTAKERKLVRRSCALRTYWQATSCLDAKKYREAAGYFLRAVKHEPLIGKSISWSKHANPAYRILKPYLAAAFCAGKSVPSLFAKA